MHEILEFFVNFFLNLDTELAKFVALYGIWVYALLFLIIFAETGLVVTPFLPGDSLLFTAGALRGGERAQYLARGAAAAWSRRSWATR